MCLCVRASMTLSCVSVFRIRERSAKNNEFTPPQSENAKEEGGMCECSLIHFFLDQDSVGIDQDFFLAKESVVEA